MDSHTASDSRARLEAIHAMLSGGHKSIRLETHTFWLWGLTAAFLILAVPELFSHQRFPEFAQRILWQNIFISALLIGAGMLDVRLTRQKRDARNETVSFVQQQVTRLWWMLVALVVVINIGMNVYGGGYLFYGITLVLIGIGIYVHGLFSRQMLCWGGGLMMVLGLALLAASPPLHIHEWVAASAFGIGLPVLAVMVNRSQHAGWHRELRLSAVWFALVLTPVLIVVSVYGRSDYAQWPQVSYKQFLLDGGQRNITSPQLVNIPAGTAIPLRVEIQLEALEPAFTTAMDLKTARPMGLAIANGELQQMLQRVDDHWREARGYRIRDWKLQERLASTGGPELTLSVRLQRED